MDGVADYEFLHLLGESSRGSSWLARCPERLGLGLDYVVVKTLAHSAGDEDFDRLLVALQRYCAIRSPRLTELYDTGQQGAVLYYAGEYFPDGSLAQPARPFTRASVLAAVAEAALGAHALHEAGMPHRSIRPGNVLIDGSTAKLGDIGLTQTLNPGQTITGHDNISAIEYLAPELIQGQAASRATDIWALGATMHRVLTGRSIYPDVPDDSLLEALRFVLAERPRLNEALGDDERDVISRALAHDPTERPLTAVELAQEVSDLAHRQARVEPT